MDLLASEGFDDLLSELSHADPGHGEFRVLLGQPGYISYSRVGIEPEKEIGTREVEEGERMGLDELPHVHHLAELRRRSGRRHAEDCVACFCGRKMVAHRADTADARRDNGHLAEIATL